MADAQEWSRQITVRHREPGYLRLELPQALCVSGVAQALERGMVAATGVYRVQVDTGNRRLIIRHDPHATSAGGIARHLFALLASVAADGENVAAAADPPVQPFALRVNGVLTRWRSRIGVARTMMARRTGALKARLVGTAQSAGAGAARSLLRARLGPVMASAFTERAVIGFFNDLVAFYLVKAHWEAITQQWIKAPWRFRYAWATTFYLIFLLVRYRKQGART